MYDISVDDDHCSCEFDVCALLDCGLQLLLIGLGEGGGEFACGFGDGCVQV